MSSKSFEEAFACLDAGKLAESIKFFELALKETSAYNHVIIYCNMGSTFMAMNDCEKAIAAFDKGLKIKPTHLESLFNRGVALSQLQRYSEALLNFSTCCELNALFHPAWCGKSEVLSKLGRVSDAITAAQQACVVDPTTSLGFVDLACALIKAEQYKDALQALKTAIHLGDTSVATEELFRFCTEQVGKQDKGDVMGVAVFQNINQVLRDKSEFSAQYAPLVPDGIVPITPFKQGVTFPLAELKAPHCPVGVDPTRKEEYLDSDVFFQVFACTLDEFKAFPPWKRTKAKQAKALF